jgi:hypothetical protein
MKRPAQYAIVACLLGWNVFTAMSFAREPAGFMPDETLIEGGLKWLALRQGSDGGWWQVGAEISPRMPFRPSPISAPASMGLRGSMGSMLSEAGMRQVDAKKAAFAAVERTCAAIQAFAAAGQLPGQGDFGGTTMRGKLFLLHSVAPNGLFCGGGLDIQENRQNGHVALEMHYSMQMHGTATMLLCLLYGNGKVLGERETIQKLLDVIARAQTPEGGWAPTLPQAIAQWAADVRRQHGATDPLLSSTLEMVTALRAGMDAGFRVDPMVLEKAASFAKGPHYCDNPKRDAAIKEGEQRTNSNEEEHFRHLAEQILQRCGNEEEPPQTKPDLAREYPRMASEAIRTGIGLCYWPHRNPFLGNDDTLEYTAAILSGLVSDDHYIEFPPAR